jgi:hypothetical protein
MSSGKRRSAPKEHTVYNDAVANMQILALLLVDDVMVRHI